jgi:hypothetical protein
MAKSESRVERSLENDLLFARADKQYEGGNMRSAFRLYLAGAKAGDPGSQLAVGNF